MAVHPKPPEPRIFPPGINLRRSIVIFGAVLALASLPLVSTQAQEGGAVSAGAASFSAGKYDVAVRQLTAAINSEGLSAENTAKALYFRGLAQQRLGQSGRAISDLGAAIWLGLSEQDRVSALVNRGLAYRAAGLASEAEREFAAARKIGGSRAVEQLVAQSGTSAREAGAISAFSTEVRTEQSAPVAVASARESAPRAAAPAQAPEPLPDATNPSSWSSSPQEQPPSSGSRLSRMWSGLRGRPTGTAPPVETSPSPTPPATESAWTTRSETEQAQSRTAPSAWSTRTEVADAGGASVAQVPAARAAGGAFRLQLSPTRSESEAMALWKQVSSQNQQVAGLTPNIEKTDMGNLGTFYRVQIGPFPDKAESLKVCNALKRTGVDCFLVTN